MALLIGKSRHLLTVSTTPIGQAVMRRGRRVLLHQSHRKLRQVDHFGCDRPHQQVADGAHSPRPHHDAVAAEFLCALDDRLWHKANEDLARERHPGSFSLFDGRACLLYTSDAADE